MQNHQKGNEIKPGSLVIFGLMLSHPNKSPACGKIFTAVRRGDCTNANIPENEKGPEAWFLDKPLPAFNRNACAWTGTYTGPVPSKFLTPINDPDADTSDASKTNSEEKDNIECESI